MYKKPSSVLSVNKKGSINNDIVEWKDNIKKNVYVLVTYHIIISYTSKFFGPQTVNNRNIKLCLLNGSQ